jgi:hypothetical protein
MQASNCRNCMPILNPLVDNTYNCDSILGYYEYRLVYWFESDKSVI